MKRIFGFILCFSMIICTFSFVSAQKEQTLPHEAIDAFSDKATVLIAASDFEKMQDSGMLTNINTFPDYMATAPYTVPESENMIFKKAVEIECHTAPDSWINAAVKFNFGTSSAAYKSMKSGDTLLLKYTVRTLDGDGKLSVRLWNTASQDYDLINQKSVLSISDAWETYYYPLTIKDATLIPNQIIFKTNAATQKLLIGDFELINYGTAVTEKQLRDALDATGVTATKDIYNFCDYYITEPKYKETAPDNPDASEGTDTMLITKEHFINSIQQSGNNGAVAKTAISLSESTNFKLGFTDTVTVSCTSASSLTGFGVSCDTADNSVATKNGDIVLLTFYARAKGASTKVKASIVSKNGAVLTNIAGQNNDKTEHTYFIPTQWTKFCLPVAVSGEIGGIRLYMGEAVSTVEFGGVSLEVTDGETPVHELVQGYFLCEPYTRLVIDYSENNKYVEKSSITKCNDLEIHGDYVYAIGGGNMYIVSTKDNKITGTVSGMGETRQIAINEDATTAVVTSRVDGAFVIALDDKYNPQIVGRCDTVEYATGVAIGDNLCYITNRMFGTEIIDISDRTLPKNIALVRTGEAQSCEIVGTTLFAGCWGERRVEAWDVSQPSEPMLLNKNITVNGKGDGLCVMGNFLYVSSGHSESQQSGRSLGNVGYGLGNGLDIYDISDIKNPVFLSNVKIDDHFYTGGQDFWTVKTSKNGDKVYAYMVNTFNGVYIFDVTNPKAPIRLAVIELTVSRENNASKYTSLANAYGHNGGSKNSYFPYDTYSRQNSPVGGVAIADGRIYIGGVSTGLAFVDASDVGNILYSENRELGNDSPREATGTFYDVDFQALQKAGFTDICYNLPGGQVYSVDEKDGLIYAACGNQGIKILDSALNVIKEYPARSDAIVSEAVVFGNRLYTAEGLAGVAIYEISRDGLGLSEISRYMHNPVGNSVKFIRLSPDGRYVLCDSGSSHSELVDFSDLSKPVRWNGEGAVSDGWNPHTGLMYFRQISTGLIGNRYLCVYGYAGKTYWYDFGTDLENSTPRQMFMNPKSGLSMSGGFAALSGKNSDYVIGTSNGKFFVFNPGETDENTLYDNLPHYSFTNNPSSAAVDGKPTVFGDLLFITDRIKGNCWIADISGLDVDGGVFDANILAYFKVAGNPDLAKVFGTRIVYPLGNQGILSFSLDNIYENHGVSVKVRTARGEGKAPAPGKNGKLTMKDPEGNIMAVFYEKESYDIQCFTAYVPVGEYTVTFEKTGYLEKNETVIVEGETELDVITLIPGDVPESTKLLYGDGIIDIDDIIRILGGFSAKDDADMIRIMDINEDGVINVVDLVFALRGLRMAA